MKNPKVGDRKKKAKRWKKLGSVVNVAPKQIWSWGITIPQEYFKRVEGKKVRTTIEVLSD